MPDITMCHGKECPIKEKCYRYRTVPNNRYQSFFMNPPYMADGDCEYFVKIDEKKQVENGDPA